MIEFKALPMQVKDVTDTGEFKGYLAVFNNVDLQGDVIEPGAFAKTVAENGQAGWPMLWSHDPYEPLGMMFADGGEDDHGLPVKGQFNMDVQSAREKHSLMVQGAIKGLSIGYQTIQYAYGKIGDQTVRQLKELALREGSPCVFPANPLATVTGVKSQAIMRRLQELEAKAGRTLSAATIAQIQSVIENIEMAMEGLEALLGVAEPGEPTQDDSGAASPKTEPAPVATLLQNELRPGWLRLAA
jgi:HK97 family phage prohead protease